MTQGERLNMGWTCWSGLRAVLIGLLVAAWPMTPAWTAEGEGLDPGMINPGYQEKPDWFKNSFLDIREDVKEAADAGKRVMLYFYQDGCPYCKKLLEDNFGQQRITNFAQQNFDIVAINIWGDREVVGLDGKELTEKAFASGLKVMFTPTVLMLDEAGEVVLRMNGYYPPGRFLAALEYVSGRHEGKMSFAEFAAMTANLDGKPSVHQSPDYLPPDKLAKRSSGRPLLVIFEQAHCLACDELHDDVLQREASQVLIAMFDVVVLDRWSKDEITTPDGKTLPIRDWAESLGLNYTPSLVFFSPAGKEVFRTEGYLKAFHVQSSLDYVATESYLEQPNFQRFIADRNAKLIEQGITVDLME